MKAEWKAFFRFCCFSKQTFPKKNNRKIKKTIFIIKVEILNQLYDLLR